MVNIIHQVPNSIGNYNYNAFIYQEMEWSLHFHKNFELIFVIEGKIKININNTEEEISKKESILIFPYAVHSLKIDKDSKAWIGVFSDDFISKFPQRKADLRYLKLAYDVEIREFLEKKLFVEAMPDRYMLMSCLYMVCGQCIKENALISAQAKPDIFYDIIKYVNENITSDITLKSVAESLKYEYHYFSAIFHNYFSMNFREFVNLYRIELACQMLLETDKDITTISIDCGFQTIRNFNNVFKRYSGITPKEYRKNNRN